MNVPSGIPAPDGPRPPATVVVVDDHTLFRNGLEALISRWDDFVVVGGAGSGAEGVRLARQLRPDLVLMDVRMDGMNGVEATKRICAENREIRVVMLTMSSLGEDLLQALRVGAYGFLSKDEPADRLHDYLRGVMRGETALSSAAADMVLAELRLGGGRRPADRTLPTLTQREHDVLRLLVEGLSNEEIARDLRLSEATVKKYLGTVMAKLHLKNRVQLAVHAVRRGVVD